MDDKKMQLSLEVKTSTYNSLCKHKINANVLTVLRATHNTNVLAVLRATHNTNVLTVLRATHNTNVLTVLVLHIDVILIELKNTLTRLKSTVCFCWCLITFLVAI